MFLLTLGFVCVYMYGLAHMEFISYRVKVELGESQRELWEIMKGGFHEDIHCKA